MMHGQYITVVSPYQPNLYLGLCLDELIFISKENVQIFKASSFSRNNCTVTQ